MAGVTPEPPTSGDRLMWDIWMSDFQFPALAAADDLGLFVLLDQGPAAAFSLAMHYWNRRGRQFTAGEIEGFLREAGFADISAVSSYGYYSLIAGTKT